LFDPDVASTWEAVLDGLQADEAVQTDESMPTNDDAIDMARGRNLGNGPVAGR
jgi:hypothetical protein